MENKVIVVGTGPGDGRYITPIALEIIADAEVLVGGQRLLDTFAKKKQIQFPIGKDLKTVINFINTQRESKRVVVLVSGDTGIFSFANYLLKYIDNNLLEFIPGISSVQLMFARLKRPWNEALLLSMHGRKIDTLPAQVKGANITALLTGEPWTPQEIARYLLENNIGDLRTAIGKDLSYANEKIVYSSLRMLAEDENDYSNTVMVIFNEQ